MDEEFINQALLLLKSRMGITSTIRDTYLTQIVKSIVDELRDNNGLLLNSSSSYHLMFVVDWADWRYHNRDSPEGMPRHLKFRLHNMIIGNARGATNG